MNKYIQKRRESIPSQTFIIFWLHTINIYLYLCNYIKTKKPLQMYLPCTVVTNFIQCYTNNINSAFWLEIARYLRQKRLRDFCDDPAETILFTPESGEKDGRVETCACFIGQMRGYKC